MIQTQMQGSGHHTALALGPILTHSVDARGHVAAGPWHGAAQGNHWKSSASIHHWYTKTNSGETVPVTIEEVERRPEMAIEGLNQST
jgi:hypothetical protein